MLVIKRKAYRYELETVAETQTHMLMLHFSKHCCSMSSLVFLLFWLKNSFSASLSLSEYIDGYVKDLW